MFEGIYLRLSFVPQYDYGRDSMSFTLDLFVAVSATTFYKKLKIKL